MSGTGGDFSHHTVVPLYPDAIMAPGFGRVLHWCLLYPSVAGFISLAAWLMMSLATRPPAEDSRPRNAEQSKCERSLAPTVSTARPSSKAEPLLR